MKLAALQTLIAAGESQTLEFKTSLDKASIESLVAFANTQGGTVLVGVTDAAKVQGVTLGKETLNENSFAGMLCLTHKVSDRLLLRNASGLSAHNE